MKKILFIVTQSEFGGAQKYIFELVSHLDKQRYNILVAAGEGDGELFKKISDLNIKTLNLKWLKRNPCPLKTLLSLSEIYGVLKREKPDILFLCSTTAGFLGSISSFFYKRLNIRQKVRVIYRIGGWSFKDPRPEWINKLLFFLEKITASLKDKIVVNSEEDKKMALEKGICSFQKIIKIYNGIDLEKLDFLTKEEAKKFLSQKTGQNLIDTKYLIGTVANFYPTKGLKYFIRAVQILNIKLDTSNFKILIIGEGKEGPNLESFIERSNLKEKVILAGRIPQAYRYLKAFDIFILPSVKEGFPWIILEAMASDLPIIATKVGALPEIIKDGQEGFLVEPGNEEKLAAKILELIEREELKEKFKIEAKKRVKDFSIQEMVRQTESLFL